MMFCTEVILLQQEYIAIPFIHPLIIYESRSCWSLAQLLLGEK